MDDDMQHFDDANNASNEPPNPSSQKVLQPHQSKLEMPDISHSPQCRGHSVDTNNASSAPLL
jgi:hypothetical protein